VGGQGAWEPAGHRPRTLRPAWPGCWGHSNKSGAGNESWVNNGAAHRSVAFVGVPRRLRRDARADSDPDRGTQQRCRGRNRHPRRHSSRDRHDRLDDDPVQRRNPPAAPRSRWAHRDDAARHPRADGSPPPLTQRAAIRGSPATTNERPAIGRGFVIRRSSAGADSPQPCGPPRSPRTTGAIRSTHSAYCAPDGWRPSPATRDRSAAARSDRSWMSTNAIPRSVASAWSAALADRIDAVCTTGSP
jgi:hypothetical protein